MGKGGKGVASLICDACFLGNSVSPALTSPNCTCSFPSLRFLSAPCEAIQTNNVFDSYGFADLRKLLVLIEKVSSLVLSSNLHAFQKNEFVSEQYLPTHQRFNIDRDGCS